MEIEWKDEILYKDIVKWERRLQNEAPFFKKVLEDYNKESSRVLDVSCGTGFHLMMLAKWGFRGVGVDISNQNIAEASKLALDNSVEKKISFKIGNILEIERLAEGSFDLIYCIGNTLSIFTLEERKSIVSQLINLLNPKGKIVIQVVNYLAHTQDEEWHYNPSLKRSTEGSLIFHVRMMEWIKRNEKVRMYVQKIVQDSRESNEFELIRKSTEFFVFHKEDFIEFQEMVELKVSYYGDYHWNVFDKDKSNDLVVIIEKNN